jgi:DNA-directed RNA polymerase beta subunit
MASDPSQSESFKQVFMCDDSDLSAFLQELCSELPTSDTVGSASTRPIVERDVDLYAGAEEIDDKIDAFIEACEPQSLLYDREKVLSYLETESPPPGPRDGGEEAKPVHKEKYVYPKEPIGSIDPDITPGDMLTIIYAEIMRKKLAGHHLDSMNSFNKIGIKQIATKVFVVEGRLKNLRDRSDADKEIAEITYRIEFTDINLKPPITIKYKSGTPQMLTPGMARIKGLTYSAPLFIDAHITATAYHKNGTVEHRVAEVKEHRIASIPCMVGTELCNTYSCSRETLKALKEDPMDVGGKFIIKGYEWTIDNLENISNNTFHVYRNMYMNEIVRGYFLSKPGDAFENSYQVILRYLNSGAITIEVTSGKFDKFEIPYYLIFRALGMTRDIDIVDNIVYGVNNDDPVTKQMLEILSRAFEVDDAKFGPIRKSTNPAEIIQFIAQRITENANTIMAKKDDNIAKYLNNNILSIIDRFMFPHIGPGIEHRIKKLRFIGHLINKLLAVVIGVLEPTDRDSYRNKRVFAAGTSMAKTFKTYFNFAIVQTLKRHFNRDFRTTPFVGVALAESFKIAIRSDELERMLTQAITTGNGTITMKKNEIINRISSQTLYHKNDLNVKSTLCQINTPNTSSAKQNERADVMRRVHLTYLGFIDISQSADTGEKVGMTKQMACMTSVCGASSSFILKRILQEDTDILPQDNIAPSQITTDKLAKVFVNGDWVGCCRHSYDLVRKYRMRRRHGDIHRLTTIVWELLIREVYFWTDVGRLMRPLVIVYNNIDEYIENHRHGDKSVKFTQWIKLTKEHIKGLQRKKVTMDDLQEARVIEYISPEEQENTFIAPNIVTLREHEHDLLHMYTHCDIDQAIFGIVTLASPMANHSNAVRNTMYTNHRKQSAGWFALNYPHRIDKNVTLQHYCERPLVSVFSDALTYPNGQNIIVALALYGGQNCEDSIIVNKTSVDCGMFNASFYNYEKAELEKNEIFGNLDYARTMDIKKDATYEYVKNGIIAEGTQVQKGHVLIVKSVKIPKPVDQYLYIDKSVVYGRDEPVYVEKTVSPRNDDDVLTVKVKLRANRPLTIGDKLSSRSGNKGIVAALYDRCDMPYGEDGLVPDALVNAHSIPTRMAVNQIIECLLGLLAATKGTHIDATSFRKHDLDGIIEELGRRGIKNGGHRRLYNGKTGEWIDTQIFVGPTTYQRLQKFAIDEHYATRTGPTSALTHQPLDGKNQGGGLRVGEMENWVFCAHGSMRALQEKMYKDSDGIDIQICRTCGKRAVVNEKMGVYKCKECGDHADIANVASSYVANLFFNEASAMNVSMTFGLEPHVYSQPEK